MNRGLLTQGSLPRGIAGGVLGFAGLLVVTQLILPGQDGQGTPPGILFFGLVLGLMNALVASGIILIYRNSRIINFAQGSLGAVGAVFTYNLAVLNGWPFFLALVSGLFVSAAVGMGIELLIVRRFFNSPRLVLTVVTIGLLSVTGYLSGYIQSLPLFAAASAGTAGQLGLEGMPLPFQGFSFRIAGLAFRFGFEHLFAVGMSLIALAGLAWFLGYTRYGIAMRATSENAERAQLLGINVKVLSTLVWTIAGVLSGLGLILTMAVLRTGPIGGGDPSVFVAGLAGAVLARLRSFPVGIAASIAITVVQQGMEWGLRDHVNLLFPVLLLVVLVSLWVQREEAQRSEEHEAASWEASEEVRPMPKEMLQIRGIRIGRWVMVAVGLLAVLVIFPLAARPAQLQTAGFVAISGIVVLSLVVLTGWANQVSLGQFALVAIGAMAAGWLTRKAGVSFWLALPLVPIGLTGFATLLGLPALRLKGLYLAVVTSLFAFVVQRVLFDEQYFGSIVPDRVDRPVLFIFDFEDERSMYFLAVVALIVCVLIVTSLRQTRAGRILIGLRENEVNVQSFGINVVRTRLMAFAISGFLCGVAGVLMAHHQRAVTADSFGVEQSINVFLAAVVGGIGSVSGALLAAGFLAVTQLFPGNPLVQFFAQGGAVIVLLYVAPTGLAGVFYGFRDSVLRIIAQRRRILVPSLFADYDPRILTRRLAPLAEPIPNSGLGSLPSTKRFAILSSVHRLRALARNGGRAPDDEAAIRAAAGRMEGDEEAALHPRQEGGLGR